MSEAQTPFYHKLFNPWYFAYLSALWFNLEAHYICWSLLIAAQAAPEFPYKRTPKKNKITHKCKKINLLLPIISNLVPQNISIYTLCHQFPRVAFTHFCSEIHQCARIGARGGGSSQSWQCQDFENFCYSNPSLRARARLIEKLTTDVQMSAPDCPFRCLDGWESEHVIQIFRVIVQALNRGFSALWICT